MIIMIPKNMMNTFRETIFTTHIDLKSTMLPWQQNVGKFMVSNNLFSQKTPFLVCPWVLNPMSSLRL